MEGELNHHIKTEDASNEGDVQNVISKDDVVIFGYNDVKNETTSSESDTDQDTPQSDVPSSGRPPKVYSCDFCEYSTAYTGHLKAHVHTHTGEKPYACDMCEYKATSIANLKRHKLTHFGLKPYTCDVCGHTARSTSNLKVHMRIHSGERPFVCEICKYSTNDTTKLKRHILKNHSEGGDTNGASTCGGVKDCCLTKVHSQAAAPAEQSTSDKKRFSCGICPFQTGQCAEFNKHMKTHAPEKLYFCHICDYRATTPANLKIHLRVHTGEKPYACPACPHRARTGPQLTIHMRTHTGEKPYVCKVCGYRTAQSPHLKKHVKRHHPGYLHPDEPEVADFRYVKVETGSDNWSKFLGGEVTVNDDATGGVRVKQEVTDGFYEGACHQPMNSRVDTCDVTTSNTGGVTVKEEVTDHGYTNLHSQTGSNRQLMASNVIWPKCNNIGLVISNVMTVGDAGVKVKEEVTDHGYANLESQSGSNRQLMASNVFSPKCNNSDLVISNVTTVGDVRIKEEVTDHEYTNLESQTGSNQQLMASNVISPKCNNSDLVISDVATVGDIGGVRVKEEVVVYDYFSSDRLYI